MSVLGHSESILHQKSTGDMIGHSGPAGHGGYFRLCKAVTTRSTFPVVAMIYLQQFYKFIRTERL